MSDETDYDALKKSVKYIPWKGKKTVWYKWHKTLLVWAMIRGYHAVLLRLEAVPNDKTAKKMAALTDMTINNKITIKGAIVPPPSSKSTIFFM